MKTVLIGVNGEEDFEDSVGLLRTNLVGSGTADWICEDESRPAALEVTANGEYTAASANVYGFATVAVNVKGTSATGKGKDGKTYTVTVDNSGNLVYEEVQDSE